MQPGSALGPYRIERELGSGGMGMVYAAVVEGRCPGIAEGARVALKIVHPHLLQTPGFFKRFLREGEIGKSVRHQNVVRTFDCDQLLVDGTHHSFLSMEYVEGQTLRELLDEMERVPEELCRHIAREVCKGLGAIHAAGVIHRDIKPDNVLITADHVVKLMDLGVARLQDEALRLSQTGAFVGSIHYAAPECFSKGGKNVDARADLHALGLVLYELACGQNPYCGDTVPQILRRVLHDEPRRLGDLNPQLSAFFEEVVHNLLAKAPDERFTTSGELLGVLEEGEESAWWHGRASMIRSVTKRPVRRIRIPRETAVYGREDELGKLRALYDAAKSGDGCVVLIEGEAGIGKSRLVDELIGRMQQDGEDSNFLFGSYPPGGAATASGGFSTAYREQFGEAGCGEYLPTTPVLVPAFDALLRGEPTPKGEESLTKDSLQTCFVNATRALSAERMTVVLIDDLHFAPDEGRSLFTSLAMAVPGQRVLLIGTTRPGVSDDWLAGLTRLDQTHQLALHRLGPKDMVRLLEDTLKSERLAHDLAAQIALKSDGNPFFLFEILRGLREGEFLTQRDDGSWVTTRLIEEIEIPSSVMDLIHARISDLSEREKELLDVAACCGFGFDPGLVAEAIGMQRIPALRAFGNIERSHRLVRSSGRRMVFDHHQVQEVLYTGLIEQLREEYHVALGTALEAGARAAESDPATLDGALCVDLCEQFLKGARGTRAQRYLEAAQEYLTTNWLHADVVALTERALAATSLLVGVERATVLARLCSTLDLLGRHARAEECAREAETLAVAADDDALRARAATALGKAYDRTTQFAEAETAYRRALELALAAHDRAAEADAATGLSNVCYYQSRFAEARAFDERCLEISRELGDVHGEATACGNLAGVLRAEGRYAESREHYERQRTLSHQIGDRGGEARASGNLGSVCFLAGELTEARERFASALAILAEIGDRQGEAGFTGNLGSVLYYEGHFAEARKHLTRHLELSREFGDRRGESHATGNLGLVLLSEGRLGDARGQFDRQLDLARGTGDRSDEAAAQHSLGNVSREQGDAAGAAARLTQALEIRAEIGLREALAGTHLDLGTLQVENGDLEGARTSFATTIELGDEIGLLSHATMARCELACLPDGDATIAIAAFTEHSLRLSPENRRDARLLLWKATGDHAHLVAARRLLDDALAHVDDETRQSMLTNRRRDREIVAAWEQHGGADSRD